MVRKNGNRFSQKIMLKKVTPLGFGRGQLRAGFESPEVKEGLRDTVADAVRQGHFRLAFHRRRWGTVPGYRSAAHD